INEKDARWPVTILGRGSGLIAGVIKEDVTSEDIEKIVVDGFFPLCRRDERPAVKRRTALREQGLAYEADPAITKHLAAFLGMNRNAEGNIELPTAVLFNGGIMKAVHVRKRILDVLTSWQAEDENSRPVREIHSSDFDLSVARGAACFGLAKRGEGVRIRGGLERSYYVAIESSMPAIPGMPAPLKALCVAPHGMEEGTGAKIEDEEFVIVTGERVVFDIMGSTCRHDDITGSLLEEWDEDEIEDISTIETTLE
ncbi:MAG: Hsp70 family protein, partial [bacterium]|nr:Hsp70 family protein [bacterium]